MFIHCRYAFSGGARAHPDEGAAFPDGGAEIARAESGDGVFGEGQAAPSPPDKRVICRQAFSIHSHQHCPCIGR